jgi:uncharacterized membrane protein
LSREIIKSANAVAAHKKDAYLHAEIGCYMAANIITTQLKEEDELAESHYELHIKKFCLKLKKWSGWCTSVGAANSKRH